MIEKLKRRILQQMLPHLNNAQLKQLEVALDGSLVGIRIEEADASPLQTPRSDALDSFLAAKRIEGCSENTLRYYRRTIQTMLSSIQHSPEETTTEDLRRFLTNYQKTRNVGKVTMDNIRRILSSFFAWLEDEDFIVKSPVRRIHRVKATQTIKETYSDEALETMRDQCENARDRAIIDLLASTGMRIGEMVRLNREDIDFAERECVVLGKGDKERVVYFDARTKIHLQYYLGTRTDKTGRCSYRSNTQTGA